MKWPLQRDCADFYGNPRGPNGKASAKWQRKNLVLIRCPWTLRYDGRPVRGIRIHRACAESLSRVLAAIWRRCGRSQAEIDRIGMSVYGGSFNFRAMRGRKALSMHSYGSAIDFDPARNGLGDKTPAMDRRVIEEFEREGWEWGGHWRRPDGMHFQAARTRDHPPRLATSAGLVVEGLRKPEIERLQEALRRLGYHEVGRADGLMGRKTRGALLAFKADHDLPLTPVVDDETWAALARSPSCAGPDRSDVKMPPSEAAKAASLAKKLGVAGAAIGTADVALQPAGGVTGSFDWLTRTVDQAGDVAKALEPIKDLFASLSDRPVLLMIAGCVGLYLVGRHVFSDELESFKRGEWS